MKRILLVCSLGMFISLFVMKMQDYVCFIGEEVEIWVVGQDKVKEVMKDVDVVLIGFQMSFLKGEF